MNCYVKKTLGSETIDCGWREVTHKDLLWLMDYVVSNGCSIMDYRDLTIFKNHGCVIEDEKHRIIFRSATYTGV